MVVNLTKKYSNIRAIEVSFTFRLNVLNLHVTKMNTTVGNELYLQNYVV